MIGDVVIKTTDDKIVDQSKTLAPDTGFTDHVEHRGFAMNLEDDGPWSTIA